MRRFLVSIGKAACYLLLFLGIQVLVSSGYLYYRVIQQLAQKDGALTVPSMDEFADMLNALSGEILKQQNLLYLISAGFVIFVLVLFFRMRGKRLLREVWAMPVQIRSLWPVVLLAVSFAVLICYAVGYIPWPQSAIAEYEALYSLTMDEGVIALITTVLVAPIIEELIFRGLIFTRLCGGMPAIPAAILASTVFAAMHGTFIWAAYAFVGGMMMLFVYTKYRSLYASMLMHILFNFIGGYVVGYIPELGTLFDAGLITAGIAATAALVWYIHKLPREKIDVTKEFTPVIKE